MQMGMNDYDIVALQISSLLIRINSVPFKISKVEQKHTLDELKSKFGEYVFLEHTQKKEEGKENILDAIRSDKVGIFFESIMKSLAASSFVNRMENYSLPQMYNI